MNEKHDGIDFISEIHEMAFGKSNDAINLVFLNPEDSCLPPNLDLRMVSEIKRNVNGSIEVKLLNRIELFKLLAQLVTVGATVSEEELNEAESFFSAIDKAARKIRKTAHEV